MARPKRLNSLLTFCYPPLAHNKGPIVTGNSLFYLARQERLTPSLTLSRPVGALTSFACPLIRYL